MTISAYLNIFDDWSLLKPSLWSIDDFVDDIVVIDGAYKWMVPYFEASGRDPSRSKSEVYDILASFGKKIRVINGVWQNESQKRQAGYEACRGRYAVRTDADEVVFWKEQALEQFFSSDCAVGHMELPVYVSPGLIRVKDHGAAIDQQAFLFDRDKVSSHEHLSYLWLVLPPSESELLVPRDSKLIFQPPVAYTAHLTHWRPPETAIPRARFYVLNYMRSHGRMPWLPSFCYSGEESFKNFVEMVPAGAFHDILAGHAIVACPADTRGAAIRPSPLSRGDEKSFSMLYDQMIWGLGKLNEDLAAKPRVIVTGNTYFLDITSAANLGPLLEQGAIVMTASFPVHTAHMAVSILFDDGHREATPMEVRIEGKTLIGLLPPLPDATGAILRRTLSLSIWCTGSPLMVEFQAGRNASFSAT